MIKVALIYNLDCPNVEEARKALLRAFAEAGMAASWTEWDRKSPESPSYARRCGSPTILVNEKDVTESRQTEGADSCRVYCQEGAPGLQRIPPISSIVAALRKDRGLAPEARGKSASGWRQSLTSLPGTGVVLLPVGGCPACWPVYSGVLGSLGLTVLLDSTKLLWVSSALLGVALLALVYRAKARRGYAPFALGAISVGFILFFKFAAPFAPMVYAGLSGLLVASLWNSWPKRSMGAGPCPLCAPGDRLKHSVSAL